MRRGTLVCGHLSRSWLAALLALSAAVGCSWKGGPGVRGEPIDGDVWRPHPSSMRIYPASRFRLDEEDRAQVDALVEFSDPMGDPIKAAGTFNLGLHAPDPARPDQVGPRLYGWQVELLTLADQKEYYDRVTRAYRFPLKLYDLAAARRGAVLTAEFLSVDGHTLDASAPIEPLE